MQDLKLIALDAQDIAVLSAHLQDAVVRIGDLAYLKSDQRFACILNRFDWASAAASDGDAGDQTYMRRRSGLRFERVSGVRSKGLDTASADTVLSLLALSFDEESAPGGVLVLHFSGDATIELSVECVEAELKDLGAAWGTKVKPHHPDDDEG